MTGTARRLLLLLVVSIAATGAVGCSEEREPARSPATPAAGGRDRPGGGSPAELPVPRTEVAGATWRGLLVVAGGLTADGAASALVHLFDADEDRWEEGPRLPVPLHHLGMAVAGGRLYVAGGYTNGPGEPWRPVATVHSLGRGETSWRREAPLRGGPRGALALAAAGDLLVAAGGEVQGRAVGTTEVYDTAGSAWRSGPDLAVPREHLAAATRGTRVYVIAGRAAEKGNFTTVESIDPAADRAWRGEPDLADGRGGIAAATVDGRLCVAGGEEPAGTIASVECLDGDAWSRAARLERPRHGLAAMALDGLLHVVAGGEQPGLFVSGAHEALDV